MLALALLSPVAALRFTLPVVAIGWLAVEIDSPESVTLASPARMERVLM